MDKNQGLKKTPPKYDQNQKILPHTIWEQEGEEKSQRNGRFGEEISKTSNELGQGFSSHPYLHKYTVNL